MSYRFISKGIYIKNEDINLELRIVILCNYSLSVD